MNKTLILSLIPIFFLAGCYSTNKDTYSGFVINNDYIQENGYHTILPSVQEEHKKDPINPYHAANLARIMQYQQKYYDALQVLMVAYKYKKYDILEKEIGRALIYTQKYEEAFAHLLKAEKLNPMDEEIKNYLGIALDKTGWPKKAQYKYHEALKINPKNYITMHNMGMSFYHTNNYEEALFWLEKAAEDERATDNMRENYALCLAMMGYYREAEIILNESMSPTQARTKIDEIYNMHQNIIIR